MGASLEDFELQMTGGPSEARYRRLRPEVERMPWGTIDLRHYSDKVVAAARSTWTLAAFQEHRTGAACAETLAALIAARVPLDLIAIATRFPLDELVHVELCARLVRELGGAARVVHDPVNLIKRPRAGLSARLRCAELVVRNFCVGEAVSVPILRASCTAAREPLLVAVLGRIVKDEAAHGRFGWMFLDWLAPSLRREERVHLVAAARDEIAKIKRNWQLGVAREIADEGPTLGWMPRATYLEVAARSMRNAVEAPLARYGLDVS